MLLSGFFPGGLVFFDTFLLGYKITSLVKLEYYAYLPSMAYGAIGSSSPSQPLRRDLDGIVFGREY